MPGQGPRLRGRVLRRHAHAARLTPARPPDLAPGPPGLRLVRLAARDFRNLPSSSLETDARFVVLHGANAQGKTNALEAIYLLASLKPLRGHRVRDLVRWGAESCSVSGTCRGEVSRVYRVDVTDKGRDARVDGERAPLDEYFAGIRAIAFTPADGQIVTSEPVWRRSWLDRAAFTDRPSHLELVRAHRRVLDQKSAVLRGAKPDRTLLDVLDDQLARTGASLVERRLAMLARLEPEVRRLHAHVAGGSGALTLTYRGRIGTWSATERPPDLETLVGALRAVLGRARPVELARRTNLVGPQTDDVVFALDDNPVRAFGSQGQVRSVVLALKLAELVVARQRGAVPLFLLDDVGSELDRDRTTRLVETLADIGGQVFVTTTDRRHVEPLPREYTRFFLVHGGDITPD